MAFADDVVRKWMEQVERTGEMRSAAGKPLDLDDGFDQTPEEMRMAHRILKNAGYVPVEVEQMQTLSALRARLDACTEAEARTRLQQRIAELDTKLRVRLEHLRRPL